MLSIIAPGVTEDSIPFPRQEFDAPESISISHIIIPPN